MLLAAAHPGVVARIVLNDIGPALEPGGLERIRSYAGRTAPVRGWPEAVAQARSIYGGAWPDLDKERQGAGVVRARRAVEWAIERR